MKTKLILPVLAVIFVLLTALTAGAATTTFTDNTVGASTWTAPAGVYWVTVECWGGGGGGGSDAAAAANAGGGGGGGAYARVNSFAVTPGTSYSYIVGGGGASVTAGTNSSFNTATCVAAGGSAGVAGPTGTGGAGGTTGASTGDVKFAGGNGFTSASAIGGGGGSSAGPGSAGTNATSNTGATAPPSGGPGGAAGTAGAAGATPVSGPGGGGGGGSANSGTARAGGAGFAGQVNITYLTPTVQTFTSGTSWTAPAGVYQVTVECWGGGGGGGGDGSSSGNGAGGGGGGAYARVNTFAVTPGNSYSYTVGTNGPAGAAGNNNGGAGGSSTFNTNTCIAVGGGGGTGGSSGAGGAGGLAASSTGDVKFDGGSGDTSATADTGGGGGGSGGFTNAGTTATSATGATAVTGGGPGGNAALDAAGSAPASGPGGGGGGGGDSTATRAGGAGFAGQIQISYASPAEDTFTTAGTANLTIPFNVTHIAIECWGGGGGGGSDAAAAANGGGGGGGGAYARVNSFAATPGASYSYTVGGGGASVTAGTASSFNTATCVAAGGSAGTAGPTGTGGVGGATGASGDVKFAGGNGFTSATAIGGGGGSSAGTGSAGTNATSNTGATAPPGGGPGGAAGTAGSAGATPVSGPGGGGGGGSANSGTARAGGAGFAGQVSVIYTFAPNVTAWPTASAITYGGALSNSTLSGGSAVVDGSFAFTSPSTIPTATGTYVASVTFTPTDTATYDTTNYTVNVTVNPKALTMSGLSVPASKVYDGTNTAAVSGSPGTLQTAEAVGAGTTGDGKPYTGDTVSLTGTATGTYNSKDVATATTVTFGGVSLTGAHATNYTLTIQGTAGATITAKALTMSGLSVPSSRAYNGTNTAVVSGSPGSLQTAEAVGTGTTSDGVRYIGDTVSLTGTATGTYNSKDVATATTVTYGGVSLTGAQAANYSLTIQSSDPATITTKALTAVGTLAFAASKVYDGTTSATPTGAAALQATELTSVGNTSDGKPYNVDSVSLTGSAAYNYDSKDVASATTITESGLSLTGTGNGNYTLTPPGFSRTITAKALTVAGTLSVPASKPYDTTTTAVVSGAAALLSEESAGTGTTSDGKPYTGNGDTVSLSGTVIAASYNLATVAGANTVTFDTSPLSVTGTGSGNYSITALTQAATITPLAVQLSGTRAYDGTFEASSNILTVANNLDSGNLTLTGSATLAGKDVGAQAVANRTVTRVNSAVGAVGTTAATSFNVTVSAPTDGNTLIAVISTRGASGNRVSSISQTGATWSRASQATNLLGVTTEIWYAPNVFGGGPTVTVNLAASLFAAAVVSEYTGVLSASPVDQTASSTNRSTTASTGTTATTAQGNELWIGGIGLTNSAYTVSSLLSSFTTNGPASSSNATTTLNALVYGLERIVTTTGTASSGGTVSTSSQWAGTIATFKTTPLGLAGSAAGNYTLTGLSGSVTVTQKALTVTGITAASTIYDGTTTAKLGGAAAFQATEAAGAGTAADGKPYSVDSVSTGGTAAGTLAAKDVGTRAVTITGVTVTGTGSGNYSVTQQTGLTQVITAKALTLSGLSASGKIYDGTNTATLTGTAAFPATEAAGAGTTSDGIPYDVDSVSPGNTATGTFASRNVANGVAVTTAATVTGTGSGNYSVTQQPGLTADITPKALTVSGITAASTIYDGTTTAKLGGTAAFQATELTSVGNTSDGKPYNVDAVSPGTVTGTLAAKDVGTQNVTTTVAVTGTGSGNYTVTSQAGLTQAVTAKALTVSGITAASTVYDGTTTAKLGGAAVFQATEGAGPGTTADGKPYSVDSVSTGGTAAGTLAAKDVGTRAVTITGVTVTGTGFGNYSVTQQTGLTQVITAKALTLSGLAASGKIYDGTNTATLTGTAAFPATEAAGAGTTSDGIPYNVDSVSPATTATGTFASRNVANGVAVTTAATVTGAGSGNYTVTQQPGLTADITPKALTAQGTLALTSKVYDGTTSATPTGAAALQATELTSVGNTSDGKPYNVDSVSLTGSAAYAFNSKDVGTATTVTESGLSLTGTGNGNYTLTAPTLSATITAKALTVSGLSVPASKVYDGGTAAVVSGAAALLSEESAGTGTTSDGKPYTGNGDAVSLSGTVIAASYNLATVAGATTVTFDTSPLSVTGTGSGNYSITAPTQAATITPLAVQLSGTRAYDGTFEASSNILTVANDLDSGNLTLTGSATLAGKDVGAQAVANRTVTRVNSAVGAVGTTAATSFNVTVSAPTDGNTLIAVISTRGASGNRVSSISQTGATWSRASQATNLLGVTTEIWYAPNVIGGGTAVTVNLAASLFAAALVSEYTGVLSASPLDQTASSTNRSTSASTGTTATTAQGNELWIGGIGLTNSAYTVSSLLNSFTTNGPASSSNATTTLNAVVYGLERIVTTTGTASSGGTVSTSSQWAGTIATFKTTPLGLSGSAAGNYTLTGMSGSVAITQKALTVSGLTASAKVYDGTTAEPLGGAAALQASEAAGTGTTSDGKPYTGDAVTIGGTATGAFADRNFGSSKAVTVTGNTISGADASNYSVTQQTGLTANITAKALTVSGITAASTTYDGTTTAKLGGTAAFLATETAGSGTTSDGKPYDVDSVSPGTATGTLSAKDVGTRNVTVTSVAVTGSGSGNYTVTVPTGLTQVITTKAVTVTGLTASNKAYDGTTAATVTGTAGLQTAEAGGAGSTSDDKPYTGDTVSVTGTAAGTFASINVGNGITVNVTGLSLTGAQSTDYSLTAPTLTANITAAASVSQNGNWVNLVNNVNPGTISYTTAPSRVQSATGNTGANAATTIAVTLGTAPANGNTLIAVISTRGTSSGRVTSITQTGATWSRAAEAANANGTTTEIWYAPNVSSAATAITINQASLRSAAVVMEYDGVLSASPLDQTTNSTGNSVSASTGTTLTTTQANELWIGGIGLTNSGYTLTSPTGGFTSVANAASTNATAGNNAVVYALELVGAAVGTAASGGTVSTASQWSGAIATFKPGYPSFTVSAGNNRLVMVGVSLETAAATTISSIDVRLDSSTGTQFTKITNSTGSQRMHSYLGYLKDSQVSAGTHSVYVSATMAGSTITGVHIDAGSYNWVNQTTPINSSVANNSAATTVTFGAAVSYGAGSVTVYMAGGGNTATAVTPVSGFTDVLDNWSTDASSTIHQVTNASSGSYASGSTVTWTGSSTRSSIAVAALNLDAKITPTVTSWPTAGAITYGQELSASTLSGGSASATGTFDFTTPSAIPPSTNTYTASVTFTPTDTVNYYSVTSTVSVTVNPKALTAIGALVFPASKAYDGTTSATPSGAAALQSTESLGAGTPSDGKPFSADSVSLTGTAAYNYNTKDVATATTITVSGLSLTGAGSTNYTLTAPTQAATITAKTLTVTGTLSVPASKVYNGTVAGVVSGAAALQTAETTGTGTTADGKPYTGNGDAVSLSGSVVAAAYNSKDVATATTVTFNTGPLSLTGAGSGNYTIAAPTQAATITTKALTVTGITASDRVYNATTNAPINTGSAALLTAEATGSGNTSDGTPYTGDDVTVDVSGATGAFLTATWGANKTVNISGVALTGAQGGNYTVTQPTTTASINKSGNVHVTAGLTANDKVYDGTNTATISSNSTPTLSNIFADDVANVTVTTNGYTATFASANVGANVDVTVSGLTLAGSAADNYTLSGTLTLTNASITPKALTVTGLSASAKVYDGTNTATLTGTAAFLATEIPGAGTTSDGKPYDVDSVAADGTAAGTFADRNVGTAKSVTVTGVTATGGGNGNYTVTQQTGLTADITAKALTVTGLSASAKVYDGTNTATLTGTAAFLATEIPGVGTTSDGKPYDVDSVSAGGTSVGAFADANVGTAKPVTVTGTTVTGTGNGNYTATQQTGLTADITIANSGLAVISSQNPSLPGASVTFTVTATNASAATGIPTGSVQFRTNGVDYGAPVTLNGSGVATLTTNGLPHATNLVSAAYAGDSNFIGSTNDLSQIVNTPPVAGAHTLATVKNTAVNLSTVKVRATDTDADGDSLSITNVSATSTNGGTVALVGNTITYTPVTDYVGADAFTYTLADTYGATNAGTVIVTVRSGTAQAFNIVSLTTNLDGNVTLKIAGIPGRSYSIQATPTLVSPSWATIGSTNAGTNGLFWFTDLDATNYPSRYYRSSQP